MNVADAFVNDYGLSDEQVSLVYERLREPVAAGLRDAEKADNFEKIEHYFADKGCTVASIESLLAGALREHVDATLFDGDHRPVWKNKKEEEEDKLFSSALLYCECTKGLLRPCNSSARGLFPHQAVCHLVHRTMSRCNLCEVAEKRDVGGYAFVKHSLESGMMSFEHKAQLDSARLKDAFGEVARDYKLMLDGERGVSVSANTLVRICVIDDGVHWVFVRCRELMVGGVRKIVLEPSRVFEFDNFVPPSSKSSSNEEGGAVAWPARANSRGLVKMPLGTDECQPSEKTRQFLNTLWAAMRFNLAQKTASVFGAGERRFLYESELVGERVGVVDIISESERSIVVRAQLLGAVAAPAGDAAAAVGVASGVASGEVASARAPAVAVATTVGVGGGMDAAARGVAAAVATAGVAAAEPRSVIIKFVTAAGPSAERKTWIDLQQLAIPHLVTRAECALSRIDNVLVMEDCGVALEFFCLRRDQVRARVKKLLNEQIAVALTAMHRNRRAFIDLHPGNAIVVPSKAAGEHGVGALKLIDFESVVPFGADAEQKKTSPLRKVKRQVGVTARKTIDASFDQERFAFVHNWVDQKGETAFSDCFVEDWKSKWPQLEETN
jgi:hypothetical protein